MLILNAHDVPRALSMPRAIQAMRRAFGSFSSRAADVPPRAHLPIAPHDGVTLVMSAFLHDEGGEELAVKVVSLFDHNVEKGVARLQAAVLTLDPSTGRPLAILEGASLTAIRTGAASGLASDLMSRPNSRTVAIFGAGVQARTQLEAVCTVRPIETVWVHDVMPEAAARFAADVAGRGPAPDDVRVAASPAEALAEADIVCAATTSDTPIFDDADLRPGTHLNAIGSYQPNVVEIPPETVVRARVVVDSLEAALDETGDLIQPIRAGLITAAHIHAELGDLVLGRAAGRENSEEITFFKSVGLAVQDAVAAHAALARAKELGLGQTVEW